MKNKIAKIVVSTSILVGLVGCSSFDGGYKPLLVERESMTIRAAYSAVDFFVKNDANIPTAPMLSNNGRGVLVSTIVDINDLDKSSALGRLLSEQIASRFSQHGIAVTEIKLRGNLYVNKTQGELLLSREIKDISATQNADLVVTGTYAESTDSVFVTIKLVRASDSRVLNAYNFNLAKTASIGSLLRK